MWLHLQLGLFTLRLPRENKSVLVASSKMLWLCASPQYLQQRAKTSQSLGCDIILVSRSRLEGKKARERERENWSGNEQRCEHVL